MAMSMRKVIPTETINNAGSLSISPIHSMTG